MMKDNFNLPKNDKKLGLLKGFGITGVVSLAAASLFALILYIFIVNPAISVASRVKALKADATNISEALTARDLVTLEETLKETERDLSALRNTREEKFGWARNLKLFKISEFYSDSDRFMKAAQLSIDALRETSRIVTPFSDAAGLRVSADQEVVQHEGLMEAFQSWVSIMPQVADQMDGVIAIISQIGDELEPIDASKYPENVRGFPLRDSVIFVKTNLGDADVYAPDIKRALTIVPRLLGTDSSIAKRYMVIMQNDKELRPTGGFWTNYATFKILNGLLQSDFTSKDFYSVDYAIDIVDAYYDFPDAPPAYTKYLKVERWYARDTNSSPDLPSSINNFKFYYDMAQKYSPYDIKPVDGIITIDTRVIEELMEITGPVTVNGVTYDSSNVVLELERIASLNVQDQINRKGVLGDLMEEMLINVFESEVAVWSKLIDKAVDLGVRKHIQVYLFDPEAQQLVERYGLGGKVNQEVAGDYALYVSTNLGGDKTNWFVDKTVEHKLEKVDGRWMRTVTATYMYPQPGEEFSPFVKRFRDWARLYVPAGSELISIEGSEDGTNQSEDLGKKVFEAYVELAPTETKKIVYKYYLPDDVIKDNRYNLLIQKQSGIDAEQHTIIVGGTTTTIELTKDEKFSTQL